MTIRVFNDGGWATDPRIQARKHGGLLFAVRNTEDLERLFSICPGARSQAERLRAIADVERGVIVSNEKRR